MNNGNITNGLYSFIKDPLIMLQSYLFLDFLLSSIHVFAHLFIQNGVCQTFNIYFSVYDCEHEVG